uniref:Synaptosomal-associated protein n=1 Tax=Pelusios castaneus TaxID=367368 RepID=A0A8C8SWB4_9SAUR
MIQLEGHFEVDSAGISPEKMNQLYTHKMGTDSVERRLTSVTVLQGPPPPPKQKKNKSPPDPEHHSGMTKNFESGKSYKSTWSDGGENSTDHVVSRQPGRITNNQQQPQTAGGASGGYITRITNDAREDEMEENLSQVGNILGNLKSMALDMGNEIDAHNKQIDRINEKVKSQIILALS